MLLALAAVPESGLDPHAFERVMLFLLVVVAAFAAIARRINVPYPILLVIGGLILSLLPQTLQLTLDPNLVFNLVLPPLLYAAAWQTNWREFRTQIVPISMLATGLVFFTVFGVAFLAGRFIPALDFRSGFLLGAIVAATDAVAATSIAKTLGLNRRIVTIIEGESLLNDATALLALQLGLEMLLSNREPEFWSSVLKLLWLVVGGVGAGVGVAKVMTAVEQWIEDGPQEVVISLIVPYVAYLAGESLHASGVLAVVACGLVLSRRNSVLYSAEARIQADGAWGAIEFFLNGAMFALIGLQLPTVLGGMEGYSAMTLLLYGLSFSALLIALRLAWVFPGAHVSRWIRQHILREDMSMVLRADKRSIFIVGWTGMRGVVSLAAALSLPVMLSNGQPFAQRNLILFLTFSVIFMTLVVQGLGLPRLIAALGLAGHDHEEEKELHYALRITAESAVQYLKEQRAGASPEMDHVIEDLLHKYEHRLEAVRAKRAHVDAPDESTQAEVHHHQRVIGLVRNAVRTERETLILLRDTGTIGDGAMRRVERNLDLEETRFTFEEK